MKHQVDNQHEHMNSMNWFRCSGEGSFFMLVREVSIRADMVNNGSRWGEESSNL
jgi:hypothetical protein